MDLKFNIEEVRSLIESTLQSPDHRITLAQRCDATFGKEGAKLNKDGYLEEHDIDFSKVRPALWLIKSPKFVLMSSAVGEQICMDGVTPISMHANGGEMPLVNIANPELDTESIELDDGFVQAIKGCDASVLLLRLHDSDIEIGVGH